MPRISKRAENVPFSPFRKLIPFANEAKERGIKVYHLNIGQPDIHTPQEAMDAFRKRDIPILEYSPAIGNLQLRKKFAAYYRGFGYPVDTQDIIVASSGSEAIQMALKACIDPEGEIIIPEPFYANYNGFAYIDNVQICAIPTYIENGFALPSIAAFEERINDRTQAIMLTNPNNPTGRLYEKKKLIGLLHLAIKHDIFLIIDEVYREFCFDNEFYSPLFLEEAKEHVIVIDSISKRYSACGARIGTIVTRNEAIKNSIEKYAKLRLSPPGLGQMLAEYLLDTSQEYTDTVYQKYKNRRDTIYRHLQNMDGVSAYLPGGAFYCFVKFPIDNAEDFCKWLLTDYSYNGATVMLSPGAGFYSDPTRGRDEVRIAYVLEEEKLDMAMDILEKAYIAYMKLKTMVKHG